MTVSDLRTRTSVPREGEDTDSRGLCRIRAEFRLRCPWTKEPSPEPRGHSAVLRFKGNAEQTARTLAVALTKRQEMPASSRNGQDSHSQGMLRQQRGNGQVLRGDSAAQETQRRCLLNLQGNSDNSGGKQELMSVNENTRRLIHSHFTFVFLLRK